MKKSVTKHAEETTNISADPKLAILQAIQRNMLSDAVLQSIGYIFLGTALRNNPELNDKSHYADVDFNEDKDVDPNKFAIGTATVGYVSAQNIITAFDDVVNMMADAVRDITSANKIIAGTLRIALNHHASDGSKKGIPPSLRCTLMWVAERS
jgi:ABC-type phosphate transport system substrate-binding protein